MQPSGTHGGAIRTLSNSLAGALLRRVLGPWLLVVGVFGCVQLTIDYRHADRRMRADIAAMQPAFGPAIAAAMLVRNDDALGGIVTSLRQLPFVSDITVVNQQGAVFQTVDTGRDTAGDIAWRTDAAASVKSPAGGGGQQFDIIDADHEPRRVIGHWTVYPDRTVVLHEVDDELLTIILSAMATAVALGCLLLVAIRRLVSHPLQQLDRHIRELDIDNLGTAMSDVEECGHHEMRVMAKTLNVTTGRLHGGVEQTIKLLHETTEANVALRADLDERNRELDLMAATDRLTGLASRHKLDAVMEYENTRRARYGGAIAVIVTEIDHFKKVNDTHGHQAGDRVLVCFAELLRGQVRKVNTVGRWGAEEILIICPQTDLSAAMYVAERLRQAFAEADLPLVGRQTASFGVAELTLGETMADLTVRAAAALHRAKQAGRNRVISDVTPRRMVS